MLDSLLSKGLDQFEEKRRKEMYKSFANNGVSVRLTFVLSVIFVRMVHIGKVKDELFGFDFADPNLLSTKIGL